MRRLACVLIVMGLGCGDNGGTGGTGGVTLPDASGGTGGGGTGGTDGGLPPAAGTMLSNIGAQMVNVSKDGTHIAFWDLATPKAMQKVHVIPAAGGTVMDLPFTNLTGTYPFFWLNANTLAV